MEGEVGPSGPLEGGVAASAPGERARVERHLLVLMAARLALSLASLVIALVLDAVGGNITVSEWHGFYGTVVAAFVATLVYQPFAGRVRRIGPFAVANIALDVGLVSALVLFSGGSDSVFTFFYVLVPVYAALLLPKSGALASAALAGIAYAGVLWFERSGWLGFGLPAQPDAVYAMRWIVHTGAILLVAALASFLVGELERAGRQLDERTSDLETLRTLHQRTVESLMSGLLTIDGAYRITSFNLEAERITGIPRATACGSRLEQVLPGTAALIREHRDAPVRERIAYRTLDGQERFLGLGSYVLRDGDGRGEGHVVIFQDVTDVVEMEQELRRSERLAAVGALAASIAHEIRNPLAAISGSIQILQRGPDGQGTESGRLMGIVVREVDRLNHLISDFLGYARPAPMRLEPVDVASLFGEVLEIARQGAGEGIELEQEVAPGLHVLADPERLRQVLWNLVHNGVEAMAEGGGALRLEAAPIGERGPQGSESTGRMGREEKTAWAELAVRDQGSGVEAQIADRIFDPFFTTKRGGTGLGLPTVHRIVEEHGGSIRMERGEGRWSTVVKVRLPMVEGSA